MPSSPASSAPRRAASRAASTTAALLACVAHSASASPLYDYVYRDDGAFSWFDTNVTLSGGSNSSLLPGWTGYVLNMTSQVWLTPADFVGPIGHVWTHQLVVIVPDDAPRFPDAAALWITGNGNDSPGVPSASDEDILVCASLAVTIGTVCSVLYQIPNAPVVFSADPSRAARSEDALVAWTWASYMLRERARPEYISYFPMAKASIKAMDATEQFIAAKTGGALKRWITAGASKRGATCWLTGAVGDPRIVGIVPIVFDVLNFREGVQHMYRTLGNWTFAFTDYRDANVTKYLNDGSDNIDVLAAQIDPLAYKENLTMSKLVVDATGDEFFQVQDDDFWWGQLPGESLRMMVDNAEHSMATGALYLITGAEVWAKALLEGTPRPAFSWTKDAATGAITATVVGAQPYRAVSRSTTTLDGYRRDFRLVAGDTPVNPCQYIPVPVFGKACLRPIIWIGEDIGASAYDPATQTGTYVATRDAPAVGWRAWLIEFYFNSTIPGLFFQLTTQVTILPARGTPLYPFPLCVGDACIGDLV